MVSLPKCRGPASCLHAGTRTGQWPRCLHGPHQTCTAPPPFDRRSHCRARPNCCGPGQRPARRSPFWVCCPIARDGTPAPGNAAGASQLLQGIADGLPQQRLGLTPATGSSSSHFFSSADRFGALLPASATLPSRRRRSSDIPRVFRRRQQQRQVALDGATAGCVPGPSRLRARRRLRRPPDELVAVRPGQQTRWTRSASYSY